MCTNKAKDFYKALGSEKTFFVSSGWLTRFKKGHGICKLAVQGEQLSVSVDTLCKEFLKCIEEQNLQRDQIYNADTTGVYWKDSPTKTFARVNEKSALGHNSS
jgi:hypothetical protein